VTKELLDVEDVFGFGVFHGGFPVAERVKGDLGAVESVENLPLLAEQVMDAQKKEG
jgi:hypothetical protein